MIFSTSKIQKYKNMQTRINSFLVTPSIDSSEGEIALVLHLQHPRRGEAPLEGHEYLLCPKGDTRIEAPTYSKLAWNVPGMLSSSTIGWSWIGSVSRKSIKRAWNIWRNGWHPCSIEHASLCKGVGQTLSTFSMAGLIESIRIATRNIRFLFCGNSVIWSSWGCEPSQPECDDTSARQWTATNHMPKPMPKHIARHVRRAKRFARYLRDGGDTRVKKKEIRHAEFQTFWNELNHLWKVRLLVLSPKK